MAIWQSLITESKANVLHTSHAGTETKGFLFAGRQVRFSFDEEHYYVDLVLARMTNHEDASFL